LTRRVTGPSPAQNPHLSAACASHVSSKLIHLLVATPEQFPRIWGVAAATVVAGLAMITLYNGSIVMIAPWDVFVLLDGGWRIYLGQVPHQDFHNPIGALTYQLIALGMALKGPSTAAISVGVAAAAIILGLWAWIVSRRRLTGFLALIFTGYVALTVVGTRPLGYAPEVTTYAMLYNRLGWAMLSVLLLQLLVPRRGGATGTTTAEGLFAGALLGLLFFCKVSYFGVGLGGLALAAMLHPDVRRNLLWHLVGVALIVTFWWLAFGIHPLNYLSDLQSAAGAQSAGHRMFLLRTAAGESAVAIYILIVLALAVVFPWLGARTAGTSLSPVRAAVVIGFLIVSSVLLTAVNARERGDLPLLFVAGLIVLQIAAERVRAAEGPPGGAAAVLLLTSAALILPLVGGQIAFKDALSIAMTTKRASVESTGNRLPQFEAPGLVDLRLSRATEWPATYARGKKIPTRINDGTTLLRKWATPESRIYTLGFTNPFPFALRSTPPKGAPLWWDLNFSFSKEASPAPKSVFWDVDLLIVPRFREEEEGCCWETAAWLAEAYGPYLDQHFPEVDRTDYWILRRRATAGDHQNR